MPSSSPTVAVVHLGRANATGEHRRVASWVALFASAGADVVEIPLVMGHSPLLPFVRPSDISGLLSGSVVPESQAWNVRSARDAISAVGPDVIVFSTLRAFHPKLAMAPRVVLDYVDVLSQSYGDRARIHGRTLTSPLFQLLARAHRRAESVERPGTIRVAAGWTDARTLDCEWVPITVEPAVSQPQRGADIDVGFVGNLSYPPNVEAIACLGRVWPRLQRGKPDISCLIAGARPSRTVLALVLQHGWELSADFVSPEAVFARLRLAVSPLAYASGIQCKVLDAAAHGIAQVTSTTVLRGFSPGFPVRQADTDGELTDAVIDLLEDRGQRERLADLALAHVRDHYSIAAWQGWAESLLANAGPGR